MVLPFTGRRLVFTVAIAVNHVIVCQQNEFQVKPKARAALSSSARASGDRLRTRGPRSRQISPSSHDCRGRVLRHSKPVAVLLYVSMALKLLDYSRLTSASFHRGFKNKALERTDPLRGLRVTLKCHRHFLRTLPRVLAARSMHGGSQPPAQSRPFVIALVLLSRDTAAVHTSFQHKRFRSPDLHCTV